MITVTPVCKPGQTIIYGVARNEKVNITCEVEAEPHNEMSFKWLFNNSLDTFEVRTFVVNGSQSTATYVPQSRSNYGTLLCWAQNSIGKQKEPCAFSIVAAGGLTTNLSHITRTFTFRHIKWVNFNSGPVLIAWSNQDYLVKPILFRSFPFIKSQQRIIASNTGSQTFLQFPNSWIRWPSSLSHSLIYFYFLPN